MSNGHSTGDVDVLLVEDNGGDVTLIERAFAERDLPGELRTVRTGSEALDWLHQRGEYEDVQPPGIVLLDLNLPATSGHDVLDEIKSTPGLRRIPVIVLTSSQAEADLTEAYEQHANACLIKPVDPKAFADRVETVIDFWIDTAALPSTL
jgi:CheY-like chemotaxis protein